MNPLFWVVGAAAVAALFAANVVASRRVIACEISSIGQRAAQLGVIWLVPALGAIIAFIMTGDHREPSPLKYPEPREPIEEVAVSRPDYGADD